MTDLVLARPAIILPPWLRRDALGERAKRLWNAPAKYIDGQFKPFQSIQFQSNPEELPFVGAGAGVTALTQKGYGRIAVATTGSLTLNYSTVISGSAPAAGDFVTFIIAPHTELGDPTQSPAGWTKDLLVGGNNEAWVVAFSKVVTAGDISSPPTALSGCNEGAGGFWVAYTITGTISTITHGNLVVNAKTSAAPPSQVISAGAVTGPLVIMSMGVGTDGALTLTWSGATPDVTTATFANQFNSINDMIGAWKKYDAVTGNNVTISKGDDGGDNGLFGFYVQVA